MIKFCPDNHLLTTKSKLQFFNANYAPEYIVYSIVYIVFFLLNFFGFRCIKIFLDALLQLSIPSLGQICLQITICR